ncbi:hypothetical protein P5673_023013 [Acropora cervicornis]|uniref:Uncharacterized protein n=1 Tax=Acropora cervicornis TaxID=6130 RepID=A0AAD9UZ95_ACRCE|nr:hypothetical protein P5673_023013 [Acropora cervicornis]
MPPCGWQNPFEGNNVECQFQHASFLPFDAGVPSSDPTELLERKKEDRARHAKTIVKHGQTQDDVKRKYSYVTKARGSHTLYALNTILLDV